VIELLILGATVAIAAWAAGASAHRRVSAARALDRYAAARGLVFKPAPDARASPQVRGTAEGVPFVFDLYKLGEEVRTRITTESPRGHAATLQVGQRDAFVWGREPVLALGEERFDRAYVVMMGSAEDADVLKEVCDPLLVIHELRAGVWLRSDMHRVTLSWRGLESDPIVLDAARTALLTLATRHRPGTPYR
jgi:hypothetical protein